MTGHVGHVPQPYKPDPYRKAAFEFVDVDPKPLAFAIHWIYCRRLLPRATLQLRVRQVPK